MSSLYSSGVQGEIRQLWKKVKISLCTNLGTQLCLIAHGFPSCTWGQLDSWRPSGKKRDFAKNTDSFSFIKRKTLFVCSLLLADCIDKFTNHLLGQQSTTFLFHQSCKTCWWSLLHAWNFRCLADPWRIETSFPLGVPYMAPGVWCSGYSKTL